jgi:hypothetical protein
MPLIYSAVKSNWMKHILVVDEKATVGVALSTKSRYLAF